MGKRQAEACSLAYEAITNVTARMVAGIAGTYAGIFTVKGTPCAASRPRVTANGTFYPASYAKWKRSARKQLLECSASFPTVPLDEILLAVVHIGVRSPKSPSKSIPRGDVDNYLKAIFDALQDVGIIHNDNCIAVALASKFYTPDDQEFISAALYRL